MRISALIVGSLAAITVLVVGGNTTHAQTQTEEAKPTENIVKVESGNTLSGIAKANATTYVRLFDANPQIEHPDKIFPGQNLRVPAPEEQLASRGLPAAPVAAPKATPKAAPTAKAKPSAPAPTRKTTRPTPAVQPTANGGVWDRLAQCESSGNWSINSGNGYYGGLQFSLSSWRAVGGSGYPHQASKSEQIARAEMLKARQGWGAWPACTAKLGLR